MSLGDRLPTNHIYPNSNLQSGGVAIVGRAAFNDETPIKYGDIDIAVRNVNYVDNRTGKITAESFGSINCHHWKDGWFSTRPILPGIREKEFQKAADVEELSPVLKFRCLRYIMSRLP